MSAAERQAGAVWRQIAEQQQRNSRRWAAPGTLFGQFARYLVVGALAFVLDFSTLYALTRFAGLHYLASAAFGFALGLLANYCLCRLWVFDRRTLSNTRVEFAIFALIGLAGLGLNEAVIWFFTEALRFHYLVAKLFSVAVVLLWNFGVRKAVLFR